MWYVSVSNLGMKIESLHMAMGNDSPKARNLSEHLSKKKSNLTKLVRDNSHVNS